MKKLKMIVTSVVVLAIVGSAFAFHAKVGRFCILTTVGTSGITDCTTYTSLADKKTTTGLGATWKYYPSFDGNTATCTTTSNGLCTAQVTLTQD